VETNCFGHTRRQNHEKVKPKRGGLDIMWKKIRGKNTE
jgi:hypothetical protein